MKPKVYAISLLFLLIVPSIAIFGVLKYQKYILKKEVKRTIVKVLNNNELVLLSFTKEEAKSKLTWEHSKEFAYKNEMYDVVSMKTTKDSVYYTCWWDNEETKLNKKLTQLTNKIFHQSPNKKESNSFLDKFYKSFFINTTGINLFTPNITHALINTFLVNNTSKGFLSPLFSPPKK